MRPVEGGRQLELDCPSCEKVTRWIEHEVKDVDAFFVKSDAPERRRMVCSVCGEEVSFDEILTPPSATPPTKRSTEFDRDALLTALKAKMKQRGEK